MEEDYGNKTMEEYLSKKVDAAKEAIIKHAEEMSMLLMQDFERLRKTELGIYESTDANKKVELVVTLKCVSGPHKDAVFVIRPRSKVYPLIGRSQREDIISQGVCLNKDLEVSSYHGKFLTRGGQLKYTDLNSTNHSYVNEELVEQVTLKTGDKLRVGQSELIIDIQKV